MKHQTSNKQAKFLRGLSAPWIYLIYMYISGLYTRLKDKDLPLEQKLQVLRFAWKSSQVFIPNKEQVLIDLLTGYLLNRKKWVL